MQKIARRPGAKFIAEEFAEKRIRIRGFVKGSGAEDLRSKIDSMYLQLQLPSRLLQVETNRFFTASVANVTVGDPHYSQDIVPFEVEFMAADPFSYGPTVQAQMTVTSGTIVQNYSFTISGSFFAEPIFTYTPPAGTGNTTTSGLRFLHKATGENVTWSGAPGTQYVQYGSTFQFDYRAYKALFGTTQVNQTGVFSRWEPGTASELEVTYGGNTVGGTLTISYAPRYL